MDATESTKRGPVAGQSARQRPVVSTRRNVKTVKPRLINWLTLIVALVCLIAGIVFGGLLTRSRFRANQAVVAVNGVVIDQNTFYHRLENKDGVAMIRAMASDELKYQFARKEGVAPTEAQIQARYVQLSKTPAMAQLISGGGLAPEDLKNQIRSEMVMSAVLTRGIHVTDDEVRQYYNANIDKNNLQARYYTPDVAQVEVIINASQDKAEKAYHAVTSNTMPWEAAVATYSEDQSKLNGTGSLPPVQRGRTIKATMPGLEDAIFNLKIGDISEPREFGGHWWIIRCINKTKAETQPFATVQDQCELAAKLSHLPLPTRKKIEADFTDFARKATVQAFWARYKDAVDFK